MKKLLLILLAGITLAAPAHGMEKIKALFSLDTWYVNKHKISSSDKCSLCNQRYPAPPIFNTNKQRLISNCSQNHSFHRDCIQPWTHQLPFVCPCCWTPTNKLQLMDEIGAIKALKMVTFGLSYMFAKTPFLIAQGIFGQNRLEKLSLNSHNSLGSLAHSYLTLLLTNHLDKHIAGVAIQTSPNAGQGYFYPITKMNAKNILMLGISKALLNQLDEDGKYFAERLGSSIGQTAQLWILPQILDHKKI
jgi:hypothetical protein